MCNDKHDRQQAHQERRKLMDVERAIDNLDRLIHNEISDREISDRSIKSDLQELADEVRRLKDFVYKIGEYQEYDE